MSAKILAQLQQILIGHFCLIPLMWHVEFNRFLDWMTAENELESTGSGSNSPIERPHSHVTDTHTQLTMFIHKDSRLITRLCVGQTIKRWMNCMEQATKPLKWKSVVNFNTGIFLYNWFITCGMKVYDQWDRKIMNYISWAKQIKMWDLLNYFYYYFYHYKNYQTVILLLTTTIITVITTIILSIPWDLSLCSWGSWWCVPGVLLLWCRRCKHTPCHPCSNI